MFQRLGREAGRALTSPEAANMIDLTDNDILLRLKNTEDSTVERKSANDYRDCLKTAVAFSNSLPVDDPGIIFIGVRNDGTVEHNENLESLQKKVGAEIAKVYPPIYPQMKAMKDASGKEFLTVIVRGSVERPHFSGPSYIRDGTQTKEASAEQFARLIAERSSKAREIYAMVGNSVNWQMIGGQIGGADATVRDCNQSFVTPEGGTYKRCFPLDWITISFDPVQQRPVLIVTHP
jgi:hypothetical protein